MYDTVNTFLSWDKVGSYNLSTLTDVLSDVTEHNNNNYRSITGNLKNYKVVGFETGIFLKGSIAKYINGDNLHTLTRSGMQQAIEELSDKLHLPIWMADVTRVDLATHFIMKYEVPEYYKYLGEKRYFKRLQATTDTLYYNTTPRKIIFYDKSKEAKKKGVNIPVVYIGENLLRYEIRHEGRLRKQFNLPEVTVSTLYQEDFYIKLINIWIHEYFNIQKINRVKLTNMDSIKTPKDAERMIFGLLLNMAGQGEIENIISDLKAEKVYQDPKYYSRLKKKLLDIANQTEISERSELINELDQNIKAIKLNYR